MGMAKGTIEMLVARHCWSSVLSPNFWVSPEIQCMVTEFLVLLPFFQTYEFSKCFHGHDGMWP